MIKKNIATIITLLLFLPAPFSAQTFNGVVRQSLTRLKVPRSHKPMMHKFGTTP